MAGAVLKQMVCAAVITLEATVIMGVTVIATAVELSTNAPEVTILMYQRLAVSAPGEYPCAVAPGILANPATAEVELTCH